MNILLNNTNNTQKNIKEKIIKSNIKNTIVIIHKKYKNNQYYIQQTKKKMKIIGI